MASSIQPPCPADSRPGAAPPTGFEEENTHSAGPIGDRGSRDHIYLKEPVRADLINGAFPGVARKLGGKISYGEAFFDLIGDHQVGHGHARVGSSGIQERRGLETGRGQFEDSEDRNKEESQRDGDLDQ